MLSRNLIERGKRFIEEQQLRIVDHRTGERDTHPHSAGKFARISTCCICESDAAECIEGAIASLRPRDTCEFEWDFDIPDRRSPGEQMCVLKNVSKAARLLRRFTARFLAARCGAGQIDAARRRDIEAGDHAKKRALATAARADDAVERARIERERDRLDGNVRLTAGVDECLLHLIEIDATPTRANRIYGGLICPLARLTGKGGRRGFRALVDQSHATS